MDLDSNDYDSDGDTRLMMKLVGLIMEEGHLGGPGIAEPRDDGYDGEAIVAENPSSSSSESEAATDDGDDPHHQQQRQQQQQQQHQQRRRRRTRRAPWGDQEYVEDSTGDCDDEDGDFDDGRVDYRDRVHLSK
jgi:hypothetical protein